ncbi:MAG: histidinol dehydrogenase [Lysobacterales bacterium]|nr:MAG: histidinol dehydrogenase [Xanthomonadales bacterium]
MHTIDWRALSAPERKRLLERPAGRDSGLSTSVAAILRRVRDEGDPALAELSLQFDGVAPEFLEVSANELPAAAARVEDSLRRAIHDAAGRIEAFHRADLPRDQRVETAPGLSCEVRYQPLSPVGLYIPGGSAPLVSTVLMLAIPAVLAGCAEIVMCSPPSRDGRRNGSRSGRIPDEVLAAAQLCGVTRAFCVGGAQAIAAMAYGTGTVPRCVKIFGPGNAYVTEAKQQVSQDPRGAAIDLPAGPSEVLVIADAGADPEHTAWDLLSQAEHGPDSQVVLLTDSDALAAAVIAWLQRLAPESPRADILRRSLAGSRIVRVDDLDTALEISNEYAPEHLIINTANASALAERARNAGSVFVGPWTPESLGDYCSGTNHVLPTYGWARSHGALGVGDFMRRMTIQQASREALALVGPTAEKLAAIEGLEAHRMAVRSRLEKVTG